MSQGLANYTFTGVHIDRGHLPEAKKGKNCMKPYNLIKDFKFQNNSYKVGPN